MEEDVAVDKPSFVKLYKIPLIFLGLGIVLVLFGVRLLFLPSPNGVEFIEESTQSARIAAKITVEMAGAVEKPGVYTLPSDSRIQDLLVLSQGLSADADRAWVGKYINLAAKLTDGAKIYIPYLTEKNSSSGTQMNSTLGAVSINTSKDILNINTASSGELDQLPGIGSVTAQKIISGRPYQTIDELVSKKVVSKSVFEKIKEKISIY